MAVRQRSTHLSQEGRPSLGTCDSTKKETEDRTLLQLPVVCNQSRVLRLESFALFVSSTKVQALFEAKWTLHLFIPNALHNTWTIIDAQ